ncbi:MAG: CYTH domain-containing protein [Candidatus Symbiothrix sp.]|jgi:CYTH domain-containing protein|nr:CYTH domain-containing protein [Candidatus Symbiothrix sp.]
MNNIEIERKFLVKGDFLPFVSAKAEIAQGYLCASKERSVRVRIKDDSAYITIKGPSGMNGFSRLEFEYPIPCDHAAEIMKLCNAVIEKERHYVPSGKHVFEVDVFRGAHDGLIIAEIELQSEEESFEKPAWLGEEVTGDVRYYNSYLASHP